MYYLFIILVIIIDQLSKYWIRTHIKLGTSIEVWKGVLNLTHYENSGAAFSSFQGYGRLFVPIAFFIVMIVFNYRRSIKKKRFLNDLGSGLLIGGAIGNAIDRILYNQVTDFITFHFSHGILNFADYAIQFGILFLLLDWVMNHFAKTKASV